ncbi:hypothetical protein [Spirosoma sp. KNUC1025]|uniref:hypothetical protein n=1 Tax=Spirosoma sp. KNUC1025 TaxID=2894082 RepID=UPI00386EB425|nr:hypothetical protein LN737_32080 [Spirosoma sp. KNUC1025]
MISLLSTLRTLFPDPLGFLQLSHSILGWLFFVVSGIGWLWCVLLTGMLRDYLLREHHSQQAGQANQGFWSYKA